MESLCSDQAVSRAHTWDTNDEWPPPSIDSRRRRDIHQQHALDDAHDADVRLRHIIATRLGGVDAALARALQICRASGSSELPGKPEKPLSASDLVRRGDRIVIVIGHDELLTSAQMELLWSMGASLLRVGGDVAALTDDQIDALLVQHFYKRSRRPARRPDPTAGMRLPRELTPAEQAELHCLLHEPPFDPEV